MEEFNVDGGRFYSWKGYVENPTFDLSKDTFFETILNAKTIYLNSMVENKYNIEVGDTFLDKLFVDDVSRNLFLSQLFNEFEVNSQNYNLKIGDEITPVTFSSVYSPSNGVDGYVQCAFMNSAAGIQPIIEYNQQIMHDVANKLNYPILMTDMLKRHLEGHDNPIIIDTLNKIHRNLEEVVSIYRQGMKFLETSFGNQTRCECFSLEEMIRNHIDQVKFVKEDIKFEFRSTIKNPATVTADQFIYTECYNNLINNASKAGAKKIRTILSLDDGFYQIDVKDNGIGLQKKEQEKLFTGETVSENVARGSGKGLLNSKRIIQRQGGNIELIKSEYKKGSTFRIKIPKDSAVCK